jgi:hypothetical protein
LLKPLPTSSLDKKVIDGILHAIARFGVWLGGIVRNSFDLPVINGAGDAAATGTRGLGAFLQTLQTGKVQQYMLIAVAILSAAGVIFAILIQG